MWEQAGVTGDSTGWRAGHKQDRERFWFSWINSTWQRWHLQSGSKHCTAAAAAAMREDTDLPLWLCLSLHLFTAPPITCKSLHSCPSMFWHYSVSSTLPLSLYFSLSSSTSLYIFCSFCASLCLAVSPLFIYIVLKATGCTLVVHWCPSLSLSCIDTGWCFLSAAVAAVTLLPCLIQWSSNCVI